MTELERLRDTRNECLRAENALLKKEKALVEGRDACLKERLDGPIQELRQEHDLEILLEKTGWPDPHPLPYEKDVRT